MSLFDLKESLAKIEIRHCDIHGDYESKNYFSIWTHCPECVKIHKEKEQIEIAEKERQRKIELWKSALNNACVPLRHQEKTFDEFYAKTPEQTEAARICREFAQNLSGNYGKSLVFCGKPGTGKTHLAASIAMQAIRDQHTVLFITVLKAIRMIKDTWSKSSDETESQIIQKLVYPKLLILDEVGIQFGSDSEKLLLFDILNERYEQRKPTILISNLTVKEIIEYLGERVFDRLKEDGGRSVVFNWESHRGKDA